MQHSDTYGHTAVGTALSTLVFTTDRLLPMASNRAGVGRKILLFLALVACGDEGQDATDSTQAALPPVFPSGPASSTNWDSDAGPVMIVSRGDSDDSAAIVLPEITDSTMSFLEESAPQLPQLIVDLFGRSGVIGSPTLVSPVQGAAAERGCKAWPVARLQSPHSGWRVGFEHDRVSAIRLDSIETMSSADSSTLAATIAQNAATLPAASDPTFRGLPFRVRSAYTFRTDSIDGMIADVVRTVNEEANPRLEHLFIIGERPAGSGGNYNVAYYSRIAGAEETAQATEVLAVVAIGPSRRPAVIVNVEYNDGGKLGLLERTAPGQWRVRWRSAYTDC